MFFQSGKFLRERLAAMPRGSEIRVAPTGCSAIFKKKNTALKIRTVFSATAIGGNNWARTNDPLLVRQMLSQLSYAPKLPRQPPEAADEQALKMVTPRRIELLLPP